MLKLIFLPVMAFLAVSAAKGQTLPARSGGKNIFKPSCVAAPVNAGKDISPSMLVSPSFYATRLPFFCRQELRIEHATGIPVKFRLGSVQYVDYLERKKGAVLLP